MTVVTLLTDFGLVDEYVGVMKGVILSINPRVTLVDITHDIAPYGILQAADTLAAAWHYFPPGSVHLVVVDPGVGSERGTLGMSVGGHRFVAPDNGVLTRVADRDVDCAVRLDKPEFFRDAVSGTFHGRDIFAPIAGHLSLGLPLQRLGSVVDPSEMVRLASPKAVSGPDGEIRGHVVGIDRFGNLLTDIGRLQLGGSGTPAATVVVRVGTHTLQGVADCYAQADGGAPVAVIGSRGYLEIAVNCGHAAQRLGVRVGDPVSVRLMSGVPDERQGLDGAPSVDERQ